MPYIYQRFAYTTFEVKAGISYSTYKKQWLCSFFHDLISLQPFYSMIKAGRQLLQHNIYLCDNTAS